MVAGATAGAVVAGHYQVCVCENGSLVISMLYVRSHEASYECPRKSREMALFNAMPTLSLPSSCIYLFISPLMQGPQFRVLGAVIWGPLCGLVHVVNEVFRPRFVLEDILMREGLLDPSVRGE